jgi:hypothetical protein
MVAGIDSLILAAFLASEKYAAGKRNEAAKKEQLENQPQGVFFDTKDKNQPVKYGNQYKTSGIQIGSYVPKKGIGSAKLFPDAVLSRIVPKQKDQGKVPYYLSQKTGTKYGSVSDLQQKEGVGTPYRTQAFNKQTGEFEFPSKDIFDAPSDNKTEQKTNVFLDDNFKPTNKKPANGYRAVKVTKNGITSFDIKETLKPTKVEKDKPEALSTTTETVYSLNGETGTLNQLIQKGAISEEEAGDITNIGAVPIGERNFDIYNDGTKRVTNTVSYNKSALEVIAPDVFKKEEEEKEPVQYYANVIDPQTKDAYRIPLQGGDWKSEKRRLENKNLRVLDVFDIDPDTKVANYVFDGVAKKKGATSDADSDVSVVASFQFEGPLDPPTQFKIPKNIGKPEVRIEYITQANNLLGNILNDEKKREIFYKNPALVNKIGAGLLDSILRDYTKEGVAGVPSLKFYIPMKDFVDRFPFLSGMKMTVDGVTMDYRDFLVKRQAGQIDFETTKRMLGIDQANKKIGVESKTLATKQSAEVQGNKIIIPTLTTYTNPAHTKAVNTILNFAKTQEEVDYYSNIIQNKLTVYSDTIDPMTGTPVPRLEQPRLEFFNAISSQKFNRNITVGGTQIPVKGFQILQSILNPKFEVKGSPFANLISQDVKRDMANELRNASGGELAVMADILDIALQQDAGANLDITLNNIHNFRQGQEREDKNKLVESSFEMAKSTSQAIAEADALEGTYFDSEGNMYPEGSGLAQAYLFVNEGLYAFGYVTDKLKQGIDTVLGRNSQVNQLSTYSYDKVFAAANKRVNDFTSVLNDDRTAGKYKGQEEAEAKARTANKEQLDKIVRQMNAVDETGRANEKERAFARRNFHKYMLAYQLAAAIQGGTGGRTISDQDVQNILRAFNFSIIGKPENELASIRAAKTMLRRLNTYHTAIANLSGVGGEDPAIKRQARLVIEADKMLSISKSYSMRDMTSDDIRSFIRDKGKAVGANRPSGNRGGGGGLTPASEGIQQQFNFTNKVIDSLGGN